MVAPPDIAALRALSQTKDIRAAQVIFDTAFLPETMIYRDECGRYVRKIEPWSIPAITRESQGKSDRRRYATWQLERLDRQDPIKALNAATGNEELKIAILEVFKQTKLREAVRAVWLTVNDDAPRVRAAARATWMDYITGPAPRPAPKAKLKLPGGKRTKSGQWETRAGLLDELAANEDVPESAISGGMTAAKKLMSRPPNVTDAAGPRGLSQIPPATARAPPPPAPARRRAAAGSRVCRRNPYPSSR